MDEDLVQAESGLKSPEAVIEEIRQDRSWLPEEQGENANVKTFFEATLPAYAVWHRSHRDAPQEYEKALAAAVEAQDEKGKLYRIAVLRDEIPSKIGTPDYVQHVYKIDLETHAKLLQKAGEALAHQESKETESQVIGLKQGQAIVFGSRQNSDQSFDSEIVDLLFSDRGVKSLRGLGPVHEGQDQRTESPLAIKFTEKGLEFISLTAQAEITVHYSSRDGHNYEIPLPPEFGGVANARQLQGLNRDATWGSLWVEVHADDDNGYKVTEAATVPYRSVFDRLAGKAGVKEVFWRVEPLPGAPPAAETQATPAPAVKREPRVPKAPPRAPRMPVEQVKVEFVRPEDLEQLKTQFKPGQSEKKPEDPALTIYDLGLELGIPKWLMPERRETDGADFYRRSEGREYVLAEPLPILDNQTILIGGNPPEPQNHSGRVDRIPIEGLPDLVLAINIVGGTGVDFDIAKQPRPIGVEYKRLGSEKIERVFNLPQDLRYRRSQLYPDQEVYLAGFADQTTDKSTLVWAILDEKGEKVDYEIRLVNLPLGSRDVRGGKLEIIKIG